MGVKSLKKLERGIRRFVRGKRYRNRQLPADEKFYWYVSHFFQSVLGDGSVSVTMPVDRPNSVLVSQGKSDLRLQLTCDRDSGATVLEQFENGCWQGVGEFSDRQGAILKGLKIAVALGGAQDSLEGSESRSSGWIPMIDGQRVPGMFNLGDQWTSSLHRSGWGYALQPLHCLHTAGGVIFDGFLEATFCWKDSGTHYRKPWVGVIHNPPNTPEWASGGKATNQYLFQTEGWKKSKKHCKGIFVLSEYHKQALESRLKVPVSVIRHPTETPERKFSFEDFSRNERPMLVQIGHWLRDPNSLYQLETRRITRARLDVGHPWEQQARQHIPAAGLDIDPVHVIPRVSDEEYDDLLTSNIVFLDLIDSSANNAIIECIVRHTPLLVNRIPPVVEYLGEDYPFYFDSLEEASRKADDFELIEQTSRYLEQMPKDMFSQEAFLHSVIQSDVYQSLLPGSVEPCVLLAHARSGSTTLQSILDTHPDVRMSSEPFNPDRENWNQFGYDRMVTDAPSLHRCLDEIFLYHNAIKHLTCQLNDRQNELLLMRNVRRIFLNRRNLLQTVVSNLIAAQVKRWVGNRNQILKARLEPLSPREVASRIRWERNQICRFRDFMNEHQLPFLEVHYEDLFGSDVPVADKLARVEEIFDWLGHAAPQGETRQKILEYLDPQDHKINSVETYRRIPNWQEIDEKFGCPETGYLMPREDVADREARKAA